MTETIIQLPNGWTLRSKAGDNVRLCLPNGSERIYWDSNEWHEDPVGVMGAIFGAATRLPADNPATKATGVLVRGHMPETHNAAMAIVLAAVDQFRDRVAEADLSALGPFDRENIESMTGMLVDFAAENRAAFADNPDSVKPPAYEHVSDAPDIDAYVDHVVDLLGDGQHEDTDKPTTDSVKPDEHGRIVITPVTIEPCEWFLNNGRPNREWCCSAHMYAGGEAGIEGEGHPNQCPDAEGFDERVTMTVPVVFRIVVPAGEADDAAHRVASYVEYGSVRDGLHTAFESADYEMDIDALYSLTDMTHQGIEVYNAKITTPLTALGSEPVTNSATADEDLARRALYAGLTEGERVAAARLADTFTAEHEPVELVRLRFEATNLDDGDSFLHWLASNGVISEPDYRANKWFPKNDVVDIPADRVAEVKDLPDSIGVEVEVWDDEPATDSVETTESIVDVTDIVIDDSDSAVSYHFFSTNDGALGYEIHFPDNRIEFIHLNPSGGNDDGVPTVFAYQGTEGDPNADTPLCYFDVSDSSPSGPPKSYDWQATLDWIESRITNMSRDDRNDAIEALRSRFDEIYDRD